MSLWRESCYLSSSCQSYTLSFHVSSTGSGVPEFGAAGRGAAVSDAIGSAEVQRHTSWILGVVGGRELTKEIAERGGEKNR